MLAIKEQLPRQGDSRGNRHPDQGLQMKDKTTKLREQACEQYLRTGQESLEATIKNLVSRYGTGSGQEKLNEAVQPEVELNRFCGVTGCPARHAQTAVSLTQSSWAQLLGDYKKQLGTGFIAAMIGGRGSGKTQLAVELIRHVYQQKLSARYATLTRFLMDVKASYLKESFKSERDILWDYQRPKLLVLDEFSKRAETDWENRLLDEMLNERYGSKRDTLIISNQSKTDFSKSVGASIASRMTETGGIVTCEWPSFRHHKNP